MRRSRSFHGSFRGGQMLARTPAKLAVCWIMDLSRAVCFLHSCTIIHRGERQPPRAAAVAAAVL